MAIFLDLNPFSESLVAKSHGRVDMALVAVKTVLTLVISLRPVGATAAVVLVVVAIGAAVQLYGSVVYMPYFNDEANKLQCGFAAVFAWACSCTILAQCRGAPGEQVEGFLFLFALPFVAHTGYMVAHRRLDALKCASAEGTVTGSACIVELRARQLLLAATARDDKTRLDSGAFSDNLKPLSGSSLRRDGNGRQAFPEVSNNRGPRKLTADWSVRAR